MQMIRFAIAALAWLFLAIQPALAGFLLNSYRFAAAGGGGTPTYSALGCTQDSANLTTYTFASANVGTAAADRLTVVGVVGEDAAATFSISSVTVGGDATTSIGQSATTDTIVMAGMFRFDNASGTAEDIVVTFSEAVTGAAICVWAVYGLSSSTPTDSAVANNTSGGVLTLDNDVSADGIHLGVGIGLTSAMTVTWAGLTVVEDIAHTDFKTTTAEQNPGSGSTPLAITLDMSTSNDLAGAVVSFR